MLREILESKNTELENLDKNALQNVVDYIEENGGNLNDLYCFIKNLNDFKFLIIEDCKNKKGWQFPIEGNIPVIDNILSKYGTDLKKVKNLL